MTEKVTHGGDYLQDTAGNKSWLAQIESTVGELAPSSPSFCIVILEPCVWADDPLSVHVHMCTALGEINGDRPAAQS